MFFGSNTLHFKIQISYILEFLIQIRSIKKFPNTNTLDQIQIRSIKMSNIQD